MAAPACRQGYSRKNQASAGSAPTISAQIMADAFAGAGRSAGLNTASPRRILRRVTAHVPEVCADLRRQRCSP
jgi:hypothetical protein